MSDDLKETEMDDETNDNEATLADDLLDEVSEDSRADDLLEGFGVTPNETEEEKDEDEESEDETETLEDDAEDVDFDRFDDVDEL